ncbi:hypothetical protein H4Q26_012366 [Puccinia striiformis f. sp. tritici PST-130]|nr:hypothetical protein H4Q26_012366 [Puccinia striiformis f. sp. tritici PST-130]
MPDRGQADLPPEMFYRANDRNGIPNHDKELFMSNHPLNTMFFEASCFDSSALPPMNKQDLVGMRDQPSQTMKDN